MSFLTGTNVEVIGPGGYVTNGTQLATFTTEDNLQKALPNIAVPAFFWNKIGQTVKVRAWGRLGTTGTPTFTFTFRMRTNGTWAADGISVSSAAITAGSGVTLAPWELEIDLTLRAIGGNPATTASTLGMTGFVRAGTAFAAGGGLYSIPAANTAFTATFDNTVTQYFYLSAACGTSNASNLIQLEMMKVYGEN